MLNRWLGLSALVIVLDQLSKAWIISHFVLGESLTVLGVFDLVSSARWAARHRRLSRRIPRS